MLNYLKPETGGAAFGPDQIVLMSKAFEAAWAKVLNNGAQFANESETLEAQRALAQRILARTNDGERNPGKLAEDAVGFLADRHAEH